MSRQEWRNNRFMLAVGVDHVTGAFLQVWLMPDHEQDGHVLSIANLGVHSSEKVELPTEIARLVDETSQRFESARRQGNRFPNLDAETVCEFARRLGFEGIERDVYGLLD